MQSRIMYIEKKFGLTGPGRIGRVSFSKSGKTIFYNDAELQSLKGRGYKANYYDVKTDEKYWVSGPKKNGQDTLYHGTVQIDEDVREEYWVGIRNLESKRDEREYYSKGKHGR